MKTFDKLLFATLTCSVLSTFHAHGQTEVLFTSWHTADSGKYARLWESTDDERDEKRSTDGTVLSVTVWDRTAIASGGESIGDQTTPVYAGVQRISYDDDYVYVESTGLPTNTMGPWYDDIYRAYDYEDPDAVDNRSLFPAFPGNAAIDYRFPRSTSYGEDYASPLDATPSGNCGLFVNGVPLFNTTDTFSYNSSSGAESPNSDGFWNRDAFVNEGPTFDSGNSHQAQEAHHYHANPAALRHTLGDSVDYNGTIVFSGLISITGTDSNPYIENFNGDHSPIIAWANDGIPMYGPYAYSDPLDASSGVRRMITGFQLRDGTNGSTDLATEGRLSLPQWCYSLGAKAEGVTVLAGPDVSEDYVLGRYQEDNAYKGDLDNYILYDGTGDFTEGTHFDLNEHNARWCVTPEFPDGTWAYFTAIAEDGTPVFPYNLTWSFLGDASLAGSAAIPETSTLYFEGAAAREVQSQSVSYEESTGEVSIVWDAIEGGVYRLDTSADLSAWDDTAEEFTALDQLITFVDDSGDSEKFYALQTLGISTYEDVDGTVVSAGDVTYEFAFSGDLPPSEDVVTAVTVGGVSGSVASYSYSQESVTIEVTFDASNSVFVDGSYYAVLTVSGPPPENVEVEFTSTNSYDVSSSE
ncbi:MAG: YHYH protein [Akkermansiaceae bacterium]